ncbi:hypothetical protein DXA13_20325 [Clostridium sp. AM58-1XD]|nr:hypothetical protein DXA13_20325 [Clostridium sp. AM58-1XD]
MKFLGMWLAVAMVVGILGGIINKKSRKFAIFTIIHGISTLILFHMQVTLVSFNHSLVMMPFYILCICLTVYIIVNLNDKVISKLMYAATVCLSLLNIAFAIFGASYLPSVFTQISLVMPHSQTIQIRNVANWITNNCGEDDQVYFIPHGFPYNPDVFRYINMPDRTVMNKMSYGSAVFGNHAFPTQLFDSRYVLTSVPSANIV